MPRILKFFVVLFVAVCGLMNTQPVSAQDYFVSDRGGDQVLRFNSMGEKIGSFPTIETPTSLALIPGPTGTELLVGSTEIFGGRLWRYNPTTGAPIAPFITGASDSNLGIGDIAYDPITNSVFVGSIGGGGISKYSTSGTLLETSSALDVSSLEIVGSTIYARSFFGGLGSTLVFNTSDLATVGFLPTPGGTGATGLIKLSTGDLLGSNNIYPSGDGFDSLEIALYDANGAVLNASLIPMFVPGDALTVGGTAYASTIEEIGGTLFVTNLGNDKNFDAYYGSDNQFNGFISRYDISGNYLGGFGDYTPASGLYFQPSDIISVAAIPEPSIFVVGALLLGGGMYFRKKSGLVVR